MPLPCVKQAKNYRYQAIVPVSEYLQSVEMKEDANSASHVLPGEPTQRKDWAQRQQRLRDPSLRHNKQHFCAW